MGKVLVIDDQRNMRTTLAMMLRSNGFEVDEAETEKLAKNSAQRAHTTLSLRIFEWATLTA